jgi:hypothetical protein
LILKDLFPRFNPCVQLAFQDIGVSTVRCLTFNHECTASSDPTSAPLIGDYRVSTFHHALTFPGAHQETDRTADKARQVDCSFVCFPSQALERTGFVVDDAV